MTLAIFTLLYDLSYVPGTLLLGSVLKDMLKEFDLDVKLGVLIDKTVLSQGQLDLIASVYDELVEVSVIETKLTEKLVHELKRPELNKTFSKIQLWSLNQYEKILYLDSDTLPNRESNLLDLFKLHFDAGKILASPDSGFPDIFNSGMFLLKPNSDDFSNLLKLAVSDGEVSFDGADQGLLNQYFNSDPDWVGNLIQKGSVDITKGIGADSNWIKLPFLYNVTPSTQYQYLPAYNYFTSSQLLPFKPIGLDGITPPVPKTANPDSETIGRLGYEYTAKSHFQNQVKLIHFIGPYKPWNYPYTPSHSEWWSLWYKYFDQETLDSLKRHETSLPTKAPSKIENSYPKVYTYTSRDSLWDPSVSSPPKGSSTPDFHPPKFVGGWGEEHPATQASKPVKKKSVKFGQIDNELERQSKYGFHWHQKPERQFDSQQDYLPNHSLIEKIKQEETKETKPSSYSQGVDAAQVQGKLEQLVLDNLDED